MVINHLSTHTHHLYVFKIRASQPLSSSSSSMAINVWPVFFIYSNLHSRKKTYTVSEKKLANGKKSGILLISGSILFEKKKNLEMKKKKKKKRMKILLFKHNLYSSSSSRIYDYYSNQKQTFKFKKN